MPASSDYPEPGEQAADGHLSDHRGGRRIPALFTSGKHSRLRPAPAGLLAVLVGLNGRVYLADAGGQNLVQPSVWRVRGRERRRL